MTEADLYFDGACRGPPGPGPSAGGATLLPRTGDTSFIISTYSRPFHGTNNEAEYTGLLVGLRLALRMGVKTLHVYGDSMLVICQVNGTWRCKKDHLRPLLGEALTFLDQFDAWTATWIPRAENARADAAANEALDRGTPT